MEVLAVSSSQPSEHIINGLKLNTSIIHTPLTSTSDSIELTPAGIVNNRPANHDGPVYIQFAENYDFVTSLLGIDRAEWTQWCYWGENVTLRFTGDVLTEEDFHLGDIWRFGNGDGDGDGVRLQVCGARVPCMKLAWRFGQKDAILKTLADTGRTGVYLKVLTPGKIRPRDKAVLESSSGDEVTAALITRTAFNASLKTRDTVDMLANHDGLLGMLRWMMRHRLVGIDDKLYAGKGAWKGWRKFRPARIIDEGADVKSFYLEAEDDDDLALHLPGQFLTVKLPDGRSRNWTISDWTGRNTNPKYYRLSIKKGSDCSRWMHENCTPETPLSVRSPAGRFVLQWSQSPIPRQVYISAGIGITPMLSMMKAHASHPNVCELPAIWIHVVQNSARISPSLAKEIEELPNRPIKRALFFTRPLAADVEGETYDFTGRPTQAHLTKLILSTYKMSALGVNTIDVPGPFSTFYICGPAQFESDMKAALAALHVPPHFIHSESFSGGAVLGDVVKAKVRFAKSKVEATWTKEKPVSLLELAEEVGLKPEYGCRVGSCGSCATRLEGGKVCGPVQMDGTVLVCSATPGEEEVVLDL